MVTIMIKELKKKLKKHKFSEIGAGRYSLLEEDVKKSLEVLNEFIELFLNNENVIEKTHDHDDESFQFIIYENNVENYVYLLAGRNGVELQIIKD